MLRQRRKAIAGHTQCLPAPPCTQHRSAASRRGSGVVSVRRLADALMLLLQVVAIGVLSHVATRRDQHPHALPTWRVAPAPRSAGSARRVPAPRIRRCAGAAYHPWLRVLLLGTWRCPQPIAHLGRHVQPCAAHQLLAIVDRCLRSPHYVFSARSWEQVHLFNTRPPVCQRAVAPHSRRQRDATV